MANWEKLASVAWSSGGSISSGTITAKRYLWIQSWSANDATAGQARYKFNGDGGTNYADRYRENGGTETTTASNSHALQDITSTASMTMFYNTFIINDATKEKMVISHSIGNQSAGAGTAARRTEIVNKWTNTTDQITSIEFSRHAGNMTAGNLTVWGQN